MLLMGVKVMVTGVVGGLRRQHVNRQVSEWLE
jgi:hypothetical protein